MSMSFEAVGYRSSSTGVLALLAISLIGIVSAGCYAETVPKLSGRVAPGHSDAPTQYHVAVIYGDSSNNLIPNARATREWLAGSGAFASVSVAGESGPTPDLYAIPRGPQCYSAVVPILTIVTLGIIPTVIDELTCHGAVFRSARNGVGADSVLITDTVSTRIMLGWLAGPVRLLPGWSHRARRSNPRFTDHDRAVILARREELAALLAGSEDRSREREPDSSSR
jgi:hypothetical protein